MSTSYRASQIHYQGKTYHDALLTVDGTRVVEVANSGDERLAAGSVTNLGNVLILEGLVNAHSHAFQRAIRASTEWVSRARLDDDFWSWRMAMYEAANALSPDEIEEVSYRAFVEMARAGITTVGEFHYLHHQPDGTPYDDPNELGHRVIRAARAAQLRVVLLDVGYQRGGFGRPPSPEQRRFVDPDLDAWLARVQDLIAAWAGDPMVTVGIAPHSIRAVDRDWLIGASHFAAQHGIPIHIHACEQRRELEESLQEYGKTPVALLEDIGALTANLTIVHGTHLSGEELALLGQRRPTVCACPTTERNLGDGFLPASSLLSEDVPISLGSDSNSVIDLFEEMRCVEYHERLRHERRNVLATALLQRDPTLDRASSVDTLLPMGTSGGRRSLAIDNAVPDFTVVDLNHIAFTSVGAEHVITAAIHSANASCIRGRILAGEYYENPLIPPPINLPAG